MPMTTRAHEGAPSGDRVTTEDNRRTTTDTDPVLMTHAQLTAIIAAISASQAEASRRTFEGLLSSTRLSPSPGPDDSSRLRAGNFSKCTARFDGAGAPHDMDECLEAFIDTVQIYKECANVCDDHALRGLPMLLTGEAAVWWRGVRATIKTWPEALKRLRGRFGAPRPAYRILRDIFAMDQNCERTDAFVSKIRAQLSKLPYDVPMEMQIDLIYGLCDRKVRKHVPRESVTDLDTFIEVARNMEESRAEYNDRKGPPLVSSTHPLSSSSSNGATQVSKVQPKRSRPRCSHCKVFGHVADDCRKIASRDNARKSENESAKSDHAVSGIRCYGCGQLGVTRSKCDTCRPKCDAAPVLSKNINFNSATLCKRDDLPMVKIGVLDKVGVAIVDTGATHCMASPALHKILVNHGIQFLAIERQFSLADGSSRLRPVLTARVDVILQNRVIPTQFLVLPGADTKTLLGRDFIINAGMTLNIPQDTWCFVDAPKKRYDFVHGYIMPSNDLELMSSTAGDVTLRDDEGSQLTPQQKNALNALISCRPEQFALRGPPTEFALHHIKVKDNQVPIASPLYRCPIIIRRLLKRN